MTISVSLPGILAGLANNNRTLEAAGRSVGDAVGELTNRFPALRPRLIDAGGNPSPLISYYLNGEDVRHGTGFGTPLVEGDELTIVAAVAGG